MDERTASDAHGVSHDVSHSERDRVAFAQAAERLGITLGAVRERVRRGTLESVDIDGQRWVLWPPTPRSRHGARSPHAHDARTEPTRRAAVRADDDALAAAERVIDLQRDEIAYLRRSLDDEREAHRRADHLLAGALERLAALPATTPEQPTITEGSVAANQAPGRAKTIVVGEDAPASAASPWSRFWRWMRGTP